MKLTITEHENGLGERFFRVSEEYQIMFQGLFSKVFFDPVVIIHDFGTHEKALEYIEMIKMQKLRDQHRQIATHETFEVH